MKEDQNRGRRWVEDSKLLCVGGTVLECWKETLGVGAQQGKGRKWIEL